MKAINYLTMCLTYRIQTLCVVFVLYCWTSLFVHAQREKYDSQYNFSHFTSDDAVDMNAELKRLTPTEFHQHPEFGVMPYDPPCENCFELIHERQVSSRMFVKKETNGTHFFSQAIYGTFHYHDNGWQRTYDPRLVPFSAGIYKTKRHPIPAVLNTHERYSAFETTGKDFLFNNQIELLLVNKNGTTTSLGIADYTKHTVGDQGIAITDAWPGINITIAYQRSSVKLNYIISEPLNYLDDVVELRFIDKIKIPNGWDMVAEYPQYISDKGYVGTYFIEDEQRNRHFSIDAAYAYDNSNEELSALMLHYNLDNNNHLSISVPQSWLVDPQKVYPIIIDPLVTAAEVTYVGGEMYFQYMGEGCTGGSGACTYNLSVPKPAHTTLSNIQYKAQYFSGIDYVGGNPINTGYTNICKLGDVRMHLASPCGSQEYISTAPDSPLAGSSGWASEGGNIAPNLLLACQPPTCAGHVVFSMKNAYCPSSVNLPGCSSKPCQWMPANSWKMTLEGITLELDPLEPIQIVGSSSVCGGTERLLNANNIKYGVPPYTYSWSPGGQTGSLISVSPSSTTEYTLTVTDACGVKRNASKTISVLPSPTVTIVADPTETICFGESVTLTASGADTYLWSNSEITNGITVAPGSTTTYSVTGTNANGCSHTESKTITVLPGNTNVQLTVNQHVQCSGESNGSITATVYGSTDPYAYDWGTSSTSTSNEAHDLSAGTHVLTVIDKNGCKTKATADITEPKSFLTVTLDTYTNVACYGKNTGSATVIASGGTSPYLYSWDNGATFSTSNTNNALTANTYIVLVKDANNCTATETVTITEPSPFTATVNSADLVDVNCYGKATGSAKVSVSEGASPYTYLWDDANVQTTETATNLSAGTYTVTVTDQNNCSTSTTASIQQPNEALAVIFDLYANQICAGESNGHVTAVVSGGTPTYTYLWDDANAQTTPKASGLPSGAYSVTVTDANNCTATEPFTINALTPPTLTVSAFTNCNATTYDVEFASNGNVSSSIGQPNRRHPYRTKCYHYGKKWRL